MSRSQSLAVSCVNEFIIPSGFRVMVLSCRGLCLHLDPSVQSDRKWKWHVPAPLSMKIQHLCPIERSPISRAFISRRTLPWLQLSARPAMPASQTMPRSNKLCLPACGSRCHLCTAHHMCTRWMIQNIPEPSVT